MKKIVNGRGNGRNNGKVKIIPLGGLSEIGKNMTVIEYRGEILVVDCGLTFPEDDQLGVDIVIPDMSYLVKNKDRIKGLVITHGHEDHIGAIPYLLKLMTVPIYGTRLTMALVESKLKEHRISNECLNIVNHGDNVKLGKFEVEFIRTGHSIPDSSALAIKTPAGVIIHTGDFKIDLTPIFGKAIDLNRFAELGNAGVLALLSDSTNAVRPGYTMSEKRVGDTFNDIFAKHDGRIIIATFASNLYRIQQIIFAAEKYDRHVVLSGRSMENVTSIANELGYLKMKKDTIIDIKDLHKYREDQIVIITTGSQGEPMSALTRIANGEHRKITLQANDLIVLSAKPIPGNEKTVSKIINKLMEMGNEVIYESLSEIHVSGHACQEELKMILTLTKPQYFLPVHGETMHLLKHANLASDLGISDDNIFILSNGDCLELNKRGVSYGASIDAGNILVDGLGVGDVGSIVLRDRKHLSEDGLIVVVVTISSQDGKIVAGPDIISRGFVYVRESGDLMEDAKSVVEKAMMQCRKKNISDWSTMKNSIRDGLRGYIYSQIKRNPMILPIIMEV